MTLYTTYRVAPVSTAAESQLSTAVKTFRYHYLCKVSRRNMLQNENIDYCNTFPSRPVTSTSFYLRQGEYGKWQQILQEREINRNNNNKNSDVDHCQRNKNDDVIISDDQYCSRQKRSFKQSQRSRDLRRIVVDKPKPRNCRSTVEVDDKKILDSDDVTKIRGSDDVTKTFDCDVISNRCAEEVGIDKSQTKVSTNFMLILCVQLRCFCTCLYAITWQLRVALASLNCLIIIIFI